MRTQTICNNFPDLAHSMKKLKISVELEKVSDRTIIGMAIHVGLREKKLDKVLEMIVQQSMDNRELMASILGEELLKEIEEVHPPNPDDLPSNLF